MTYGRRCWIGISTAVQSNPADYRLNLGINPYIQCFKVSNLHALLLYQKTCFKDLFFSFSLVSHRDDNPYHFTLSVAGIIIRIIKCFKCGAEMLSCCAGLICRCCKKKKKPKKSKKNKSKRGRSIMTKWSELLSGKLFKDICIICNGDYYTLYLHALGSWEKQHHPRRWVWSNQTKGYSITIINPDKEDPIYEKIVEEGRSPGSSRNTRSTRNRPTSPRSESARSNASQVFISSRSNKRFDVIILRILINGAVIVVAHTKIVDKITIFRDKGEWHGTGERRLALDQMV